MKVKVAGLVAGTAFGFLLSWARLSDPTVIRKMLLLREAHVFSIMGSAIAIAFIGLRLLRRAAAHAFVTGEPIGWSVQPPERRHVIGSMLFGAGWSVAGTCPGPVAAMIGEGHGGGLAVVVGILAGVALQPTLARTAAIRWQPTAGPHPAGL